MAFGPVGQIHISVTDLDRSVAFYRDVLGIELEFQVPGQPMAFFASGDVRLYLGIPTDPSFTSRCVLYFRVDDLTAEVARLHSAGVALTVPERPVYREGDAQVWMASLTDPDGHQLVMMQARPDPAD